MFAVNLQIYFEQTTCPQTSRLHSFLMLLTFEYSLHMIYSISSLLFLNYIKKQRVTRLLQQSIVTHMDLIQAGLLQE